MSLKMKTSSVSIARSHRRSQRGRGGRCVTSTSLAITSFVCLMRRSPDARVRTSASGSAENDDISYSFSKKASAIENTRDLASYCRSPEKGTIGMSEFRIQRRHCSVGDTWKRFSSSPSSAPPGHWLRRHRLGLGKAFPNSVKNQSNALTNCCHAASPFVGAHAFCDRAAVARRPGFQFNLLTGTHAGVRCPRSETCRAKGNTMQVPSILRASCRTKTRAISRASPKAWP
jgi:hypothetical protein